MVTQILTNIGWAISFTLIGALIGTILMISVATILPRIIDRSTPDIDEAKEILRGNEAVAEYFGRVVSATIIGISIIIAASVLGGILAGLHG
ncbi:DUF350 domain-containing protein [Legionella fallonii]|uniref:Uncharacterized protein n=1 Tax=Legionella fallonii LLAP-10 TaxID=1212491 RepID=A0A098G4H8_9GAMM|nr:DUF350 domain-containing protein [Legionella fallonii]CEG57398.1 protein of unknown function [Legionella fallonii LLAP-10]